MKFFLSLLIALSINSFSQDQGIEDVANADSNIEVAAEVVSLTIEQAVMGCKDIMQIEQGGNGPEGIVARFYNQDFIQCLSELYMKVNPTVDQNTVSSLLLQTYMSIFEMQSNVSVIARKYSRDVELKVATQYRLLSGSKTIIVENEEAFFGHGTTASEPLSNIVGFILEL